MKGVQSILRFHRPLFSVDLRFAILFRTRPTTLMPSQQRLLPKAQWILRLRNSRIRIHLNYRIYRNYRFYFFAFASDHRNCRSNYSRHHMKHLRMTWWMRIAKSLMLKPLFTFLCLNWYGCFYFNCVLPS